MPRTLLAIAVGAACLCANALAFSASSSLPRTASFGRGSSSSTLLRSTADDDSEVRSLPRSGVSDRRSALLRSASTASSFLLAAAAGSPPANAGIDPAALRALPVEGDTTGITTRLRQIESVNGPRPDDSKDIAFDVLPSGASYREFREGKGDVTVAAGSKIAVQMTIRCKSFATANEPGGVKYFSTKADTEFDELAWTVGDGSAPPELEEAMMGMRRQAVRRIEVPSTAVFRARDNGQLPQPGEGNKEGRRVLERLFKTDATLLYEVLVTRIK